MNDADTLTDATAPVTLPAGPLSQDEADTLGSVGSSSEVEPRIVDGACTVCDVAIEDGCCDCGPVDRDVDPDRFGDADVPDLFAEIE